LGGGGKIIYVLDKLNTRSEARISSKVRLGLSEETFPDRYGTAVCVSTRASADTLTKEDIPEEWCLLGCYAEWRKSQKTPFFIVTAVKTSNLTEISLIVFGIEESCLLGCYAVCLL
jgi:hypothetical protein